MGVYLASEGMYLVIRAFCLEISARRLTLTRTVWRRHPESNATTSGGEQFVMTFRTEPTSKTARQATKVAKPNLESLEEHERNDFEKGQEAETGGLRFLQHRGCPCRHDLRGHIWQNPGPRPAWNRTAELSGWRFCRCHNKW